MRYNIIILLTIYAMISPKLVAQEAEDYKNNEWILRVGENRGFNKDLNYAPLTFSGKGKSYSLDYYRKDDDEQMFNVSFELNLNKLNSRASDYFESADFAGHLEVGYLKSLEPSSDIFNLYIGGQLRSTLQLTTLNVQDAFTFFGHHDLRAKTLATFKLKHSHRLSSSLSLPLASFIARPPYNGYDSVLEEDFDDLSFIFKGYLTSLHEYFNIEWVSDYRFQLFRYLDLNFNYTFRYHRLYKNLQLQNFENQFKIGLIIKY